MGVSTPRNESAHPVLSIQVKIDYGRATNSRAWQTNERILFTRNDLRK
jgi:hypothetical protein